MDKLMEKLMVAKAIMDKAENIKRGENTNTQRPEIVNEFEVPSAKYNIPTEYMDEQKVKSVPKDLKTPTVEAIKNSKLPDEIKKLMIENPINIPQQQQSSVLSDDLIERASRLMKKNDEVISETVNKTPKNVSNNQIDYQRIQKMIENAINKSLKENGLLIESTEKSTESFSFRVGKHIFEGKITKIKKIE